MKITWQVDDGYVGGERPQVIEIPDEHLMGLDPQEMEAEIEEYIHEEFMQNISWEILRIE